MIQAVTDRQLGRDERLAGARDTEGNVRQTLTFRSVQLPVVRWKAHNAHRLRKGGHKIARIANQTTLQSTEAACYVDAVPTIGEKLTIISPIDCRAETRRQADTATAREEKYIASRFNSIAHDAGQLVIWNSYSGSINVFSDQDATTVAAILDRGYADKPCRLSEYLIKRGFLVRDDVNEFQRHQLRFGQSHYRSDILELILLASEECNFRCTYCYETFPRGEMLPNVRAAVIRLLHNRVPKLNRLSIGWFGGEPLHGLSAIAEIAPAAQKLASDYHVRYDSHITTNGYLLDPRTAESLLSWNIRRYQITLDGTEETHDKLRPLRTGEKTFQRIFANLRSLKSRPDAFTVRIRVNFNGTVISEAEPLLDLLQKEFAGDERFAIAFHPIGKWGGPNDGQLEVCGTRDGNVMKLELAQKASARGLNVGSKLQEVSGYGSNVCYAARPYNFVINAEGKVLKCTVALDKADHNIIGTLQDDGSLALDDSKLALWTNPAFETDKTCQSCSLLGSCQGLSCPLVRIEGGHRPCISTPKPMLKQELMLAALHGAL